MLMGNEHTALLLWDQQAWGWAVSLLLGYRRIHLFSNSSNHWHIHADLLDHFQWPSWWLVLLSCNTPLKYPVLTVPAPLTTCQIAYKVSSNSHHYLSSHCSKKIWGMFWSEAIILFILMLCLPGFFWVWKSLEGSSFCHIGRAFPGGWRKACSLGQKSFTFLIHSSCGSRSVPCSLGAPKKTFVLGSF